ncbi:phosphotransferase [Micromonospora sp. NPDC051227]|uniref:phosphotransferase n=1 Tax=Micromonospora sp. NPDC051227 TaxID=3364285 RepID=UPI0037B451FF
MADSDVPESFSIIPEGGTPDARVLMTRTPAGFSLPSHRCRDIPSLNEFIAKMFGLEVVTTECVRDLSAGPADPGPKVFAHEVLGCGRVADHNAAWVSVQDLPGLALVAPEHREVVEVWLRERRVDAAPARGVPWACAGWFETAASWMSERLEALGREPAGRVEQVDVRLWSTLLRVPVTGGGFAYFKAVPPVSAHEPLLTRVLADRFPGRVPTVLAADEARGWMLMEDFGPVIESEDPAEIVDAYLATMPALARIQVELAGDVTTLDGLGCPNRRTRELPEFFAALLDDMDALRIGDGLGLTVEECKRLRSWTEEFAEICDRLAQGGVPDSLVHSDAWRGNFTRSGSGPLIFDWAESAVGHPFLSLAVVRQDIRDVLPDGSADAAISRVTEEYLREWCVYANPEDLAEIARYSVAPGLVNRALEWHRSIASLDVTRTGFYRYAVPVNLRRLLAFT